MTLFDLITYANIGVLIMHDEDPSTMIALQDELNNAQMIWDDLLGEPLEDLAISKLPFTDGSGDLDDFDESHFINEDDGFNPYMGQYDWDC